MNTTQKLFLGFAGVVLLLLVVFPFVDENVDSNGQIALASYQSPIEKAILNSFQIGDVSELIPYLHEEVHLNILDKEPLFTVAETETGLQHFFDEISPRKMLKKHGGISKGGKGGYIIATLISEKGDAYRCYFYTSLEKILSIEIREERALG